MNSYQVTYSIYSNNINESGAWLSSGPSQYTTVVTAFNPSIAKQLVENQNGGSNHCLVRSVQLV